MAGDFMLILAKIYGKKYPQGKSHKIFFIYYKVHSLFETTYTNIALNKSENNHKNLNVNIEIAFLGVVNENWMPTKIKISFF